MAARDEDAAPAPRRVENIDIAQLPLSPADAFVLSQLDGVTGLDDIALVTGLDLEALRATLARLERLGAVHVARMRAAHLDDAPAAPALDAAQRERIDAMFERLETASHYALLGVPHDADKKAIKNAYYALIPLFHPDKYFGRDLGPYKKKLERIFERLTEAEGVLTRKSARAEYDRYLESRREAHAITAVLSSIPPPPRSERPAAPMPPSMDPARAAEERSRALARRLAQLRAPAPAPLVSAPPTAPESIRDRASESMRRFVAARRSPRLDAFVRAGEEAMAGQSWVSAVNALRIASTMAPEDAAIRALYDEADAQAQRHLSRSYEASARYEEKNGHWEQAARSWQRVASARPEDPAPLQRVAECLLHANDPRESLKPARQAVQLAPNALEYRLTLIRAYEAAGLVASAVGEIGRALEKHPDDAELRAWRARLEAR